MRKLFTLLTSAACLLAFLILAPTAPAQSPEAEAKVIALAQQLKLTPQQEVEVLPILKAEAPKFDAIKNDPSMSGMQKMKALHSIHAENAPQLQKILSPAQYQQLQAIREAKNFLQLRCVFGVDGMKCLHLLHPGHRRIVLDRIEFWSLCLQDGQDLDLLLRCKF